MAEPALNTTARPDLKIAGNIHHAAYRCRDAEQTRWFYEDVMGLPLAAALSFEIVPGTDEDCPYLHLFFELGDGNFIAFFDAPDNADPAYFNRKHSFDMHIAFEVDSVDDMLAWQALINERGKSCLGPVDHGFVKSVYMYDPNGIQVEITAKTEGYDQIMAQEKEHSRQNIKDWCAETRARKEAMFGAEAIDKRGHKK